MFQASVMVIRGHGYRAETGRRPFRDITEQQT